MTINLKIATLVFLLAAIPITLFPPFNWGEERLQTEAERRQSIDWGGEYPSAKEVLPVKRRAFLFGETKQPFTTKHPRIDIETKISLDRKIIVGDLVLEYIFAMLFSVLVGWLAAKRRG